MEQWLPTLMFTVLIGVALFVRFKRSFGRQLVQPRRMIFRIGLLAVLGTVFLVRGFSLTNMGAAAAGLVAGCGLALLALKTTVFEQENEQSFYTPNKWIGLGVIALFVGRLAARYLTMREVLAQNDPAAGFATMHRSPVTTGIFFLMAGYYALYFIEILRRRPFGQVAEPTPFS